MSISLRIYSDIHQEIREVDESFFNIAVLDNEKDQILILAGDYDQINRLNKPFKESMLRKEMFKSLCERFKYVLYVFGNHEYYQGKIGGSYSDKNLSFSHDIPNLHILSRYTPSVYIDGIKFVGATLWTSLNNVSYLDKYKVSDVSKIKQFNKGRFGHLQKDFVVSEHEQDLKWIKNEIKGEDNVVVITHYPPIHIVDPRYKNDIWKDHNCNQLNDFILENKQIRLWVCGHVHQKDLLIKNVGETKIFMNTIGNKKQTDEPEKSVIVL